MCNLAALARIFDSTANSTAHASPRLRQWQCPVPLLGTPQESNVATSEGCLSKTSFPQPLTCGWAPYLLLGVIRGTLKLEALWLGLLSCLLEHLAMFSVRVWCKRGGECRGDPQGVGGMGAGNTMGKGGRDESPGCAQRDGGVGSLEGAQRGRACVSGV